MCSSVLPAVARLQAVVTALLIGCAIFNFTADLQAASNPSAAFDIRSAPGPIGPIDLLDQFDTRTDGATADDEAGYSVSDAGDVNSDGLHDLMVGAPGAVGNDRAASGSAFTVFGKNSSTNDESGLRSFRSLTNPDYSYNYLVELTISNNLYR